MRRLFALAITLATLAACKDDPASPIDDASAPTSDAGFANDSATVPPTSDATTPGTDSGPTDCPGVASTPDPDAVATLRKVLGGWRWSKDVVNGNDAELTECDRTIGYFIGPDVVTSNDYAACAVARGDVVPLRGGNYASTATGCTPLVCSKMGVLMSGKAARVFALDDNGKPTGSPAFVFQVVSNAAMSDFDLIQSNTGTLTTGKRLVHAAGVPSCQ